MGLGWEVRMRLGQEARMGLGWEARMGLGWQAEREGWDWSLRWKADGRDRER